MSEARAEIPAAEVPVETAPVASASEAISSPETPVTSAAEPAPVATPEPSLLGTEATQPEVSPEAPTADPAPVTYEPFTFPEGIQAEPERIAAFTALIGEHKLPQEAAQKLIDLHVADRQAMIDAQPQQWRNAFNETRQGWVRDVESRFGNSRDTVLNAARSALKMAATNDAHLAKMWDVLAFTGAGDHPDIIEGFRNLNRLLSERKAPPPPDAPPKVNGAGPRPEDRRYPTMNQPRTP